MRSAIFDSAVRPVVIVLLDPTSDRCSRFFQAPILRRPDFLFFQAAMEPFDVAVAFRVMIRRPPMRDAQPVQGLDEPRRSELRAIVGGQRYVRLRGCPRAAVPARLARPQPAHLRFGNDARDSIPRSPACSSRSRTPGRPSPLPAPPRSSSCPTARSDSARLLPHGPTLSSVVPADGVSAPATHVRASPAAHACDSPEDFLFFAATKSRGDIRTRVFLRTPRRSARRSCRSARLPRGFFR